MPPPARFALLGALRDAALLGALCTALLLTAPAATAQRGPRAPELGRCGEPATPIAQIQGRGAESPLRGRRVVVEAVVVGDFQDEPLAGFFLQQEDAGTDGDPSTSEGLFVFEGARGRRLQLREGQRVRVRGEVAERDGLTQLRQLAGASVCPGDARVSDTPLVFPLTDPDELERLEGMRVHIAEQLTVTGNDELGRYGVLELSSGGRLFAPTQLAAPGAAAREAAALNARRRIGLDDRSTRADPRPLPYRDTNGTRRLGDSVASLTGIVDGRFGRYRIQPTAPVRFRAENPRPAAPPSVGGRLRVASLNAFNYFVTLDDGRRRCGPARNQACRGADSAQELADQRGKLVHAIAGLRADILALLEVENDSGAAVADLVTGLNARLGAGSYAALQTGPIGSDAIRVAILYRPAQVRPHGRFALLDASRDRRFRSGNRPSLAQTFEELASGERLTVVANHFKSKGSSCGARDPDRGDGQGPCAGTRTDAARALLEWLARDPTASGDPDFLVLGDFNAYAREDAIRALVAGGLDPLVQRRIGERASSFQFEAASGSLDHAFASASLAPQVTGVAEWAINADEPAALDYNRERRSGELFQPDNPYRSSDHDPLLVGLALQGVPRPCPQGAGRSAADCAPTPAARPRRPAGGAQRAP